MSDPRWCALFDAAVEDFKQGRFLQAVDGFTKALPICGEANKLRVLDSRSAAYAKSQQFKLAAADAKSCIQIDKGHYKGYVRSAKVFEQMRLYAQSLSMLRHAVTVASDQVQPKIRKQISEMELKVALSNRSFPPVSTRIDPAAHLPLEIMERIFELGVDGGQPDFVLKPSQVSRQWRAVALASPKAWKWFRYRFTSSREKVGYRKLKAWIARTSGAVYLERVEIAVPGEMNLAAAETMLRECMPQLQELRLRTDHPAEVLTTIRKLQGSAKRMEILDIVARTTVVDVRGIQSFDWLDFGLLSPGCHTISEITCAGIQVSPNTPLSIHLTALRRIRAGAIALGSTAPSTQTGVDGATEAFLRKLAGAESVRELDLQPLLGNGSQRSGIIHTDRSIGAPSTVDSRNIPLQSIKFPHLETVSGLPLEFLHRMELPSVKSLAIDPRETLHNNLTLQLAVKAHIRLDQLTRLDCADVPRGETHSDGQAGYLARYLPNLAALQTLVFRRAVDSAVVERLADIKVCPVLQKLTLIDGEVTSTPLMRMVENRRDAGKAMDGTGLCGAASVSPIRVLVLDNCQKIQSEAEAWLRRNVPDLDIRRSKQEKPSFKDARASMT